MNKRLVERIEKFLAKRRKSRGGWAEVQPLDVKQLEDIIQELIKAKFEKDPDGDLPIEFQVVDRTRFERVHFQPVPYLRSTTCTITPLKDIEDTLNRHLTNLDVAINCTTRARGVLRDAREAELHAIWRQRLEELTKYKVFLQQLTSARATLPSPIMVALKALAIMNGQDSQENQAQRL